MPPGFTVFDGVGLARTDMPRPIATQLDSEIASNAAAFPAEASERAVNA